MVKITNYVINRVYECDIKRTATSRVQPFECCIYDQAWQKVVKHASQNQVLLCFCATNFGFQQGRYKPPAISDYQLLFSDMLILFMADLNVLSPHIVRPLVLLINVSRP